MSNIEILFLNIRIEFCSILIAIQVYDLSL